MKTSNFKNFEEFVQEIWRSHSMEDCATAKENFISEFAKFKVDEVVRYKGRKCRVWWVQVNTSAGGRRYGGLEYFLRYVSNNEEVNKKHPIYESEIEKYKTHK